MTSSLTNSNEAPSSSSLPNNEEKDKARLATRRKEFSSNKLSSSEGGNYY